MYIEPGKNNVLFHCMFELISFGGFFKKNNNNLELKTRIIKSQKHWKNINPIEHIERCSMEGKAVFSIFLWRVLFLKKDTEFL